MQNLINAAVRIETFVSQVALRGIWISGVRFLRACKRMGFRPALAHVKWVFRSNYAYKLWVRSYLDHMSRNRELLGNAISKHGRLPKISVLMPAHNSTISFLRLAIESVIAQSYTNWELCIVDDGSDDQDVLAVLKEYGEKDSRVRYYRSHFSNNISGATNLALAMADGEYIALLDHDDELCPLALSYVALAVLEHPDVCIVYSDEDKITENGKRFSPYFKPGFNRDLLRSHNLISHLGVYRTDIVRELGGFRSSFDGSQDWDLALRVSEMVESSRILHIPAVLYHWRAVSGSTALDIAEKPYTVRASVKAVEGHLQRVGEAGKVVNVFSSFNRVSYKGKPSEVAVDIVSMPSLNELQDASASTVGGVSIAGKLNAAATNASRPVLLFVGAHLNFLSEKDISVLVNSAIRPDISCCGPAQVRESGLMYAGLSVLRPRFELASISALYQFMYINWECTEPGVAGRNMLQQNVSLLAPGCFAIRRELFLELGGFDETNYPSCYFEVDLFLRALERGYRNLWIPDAKVYTRTVSEVDITGRLDGCDAELKRLRNRITQLKIYDKYDNCNISFGDTIPYPVTSFNCEEVMRRIVKS